MNEPKADCGGLQVHKIHRLVFRQVSQHYVALHVFVAAASVVVIVCTFSRLFFKKCQAIKYLYLNNACCTLCGVHSTLYLLLLILYGIHTQVKKYYT